MVRFKPQLKKIHFMHGRSHFLDKILEIAQDLLDIGQNCFLYRIQQETFE